MNDGPVQRTPLRTRSVFISDAHLGFKNDVIGTIPSKVRHGTRVVYVPGNHDRVFRDDDGLVMGNVETLRAAMHQAANGRRFLVLHGAEFDSILRVSPLRDSLPVPVPVAA